MSQPIINHPHSSFSILVTPTNGRPLSRRRRTKPLQPHWAGENTSHDLAVCGASERGIRMYATTWS
jgi:hypothetical protein